MRHFVTDLCCRFSTKDSFPKVILIRMRKWFPLNERGRRTLLSAWEKRKQEQIVHPFLKEKVPIGLIPYVQAMLFARVFVEIWTIIRPLSEVNANDACDRV